MKPLKLRGLPSQGKPYSRLIPYDHKKYRPYRRALSKQVALEKRWFEEDQRNLHRRVEVRPFLWT